VGEGGGDIGQNVAILAILRKVVIVQEDKRVVTRKSRC